jgi:hypothetical protein
MGGSRQARRSRRANARRRFESKTNFFAPIPKATPPAQSGTPLHSRRSTIVLQTNITRGHGKLAAIHSHPSAPHPASERHDNPTPRTTQLLSATYAVTTYGTDSPVLTN